MRVAERTPSGSHLPWETYTILLSSPFRAGDTRPRRDVNYARWLPLFSSEDPKNATPESVKAALSFPASATDTHPDFCYVFCGCKARLLNTSETVMESCVSPLMLLLFYTTWRIHFQENRLIVWSDFIFRFFLSSPDFRVNFFFQFDTLFTHPDFYYVPCRFEYQKHRLLKNRKTVMQCCDSNLKLLNIIILDNLVIANLVVGGSKV